MFLPENQQFKKRDKVPSVRWFPPWMISLPCGEGGEDSQESLRTMTKQPPDGIQ
jgi:hypothetical protein